MVYICKTKNQSQSEHYYNLIQSLKVEPSVIYYVTKLLHERSKIAQSSLSSHNMDKEGLKYCINSINEDIKKLLNL